MDCEIRDLTTEPEFRACLALQEQTWGANFSEFVPAGMLKIVQKIGGIAAGAFDEAGNMAGFVFGISGMRHGRPAHWSHMLAVRAPLQNAGLGRRLKEYQRARLLDLGIEWMHWTFDPLVARNAHFNLNKLGVTIDEYVEDMYSGGDRGPLDAVIGTDRFIARWDLRGAPPPSAALAIGDLSVAVVVRSEGGGPVRRAGSPPDAPEVYVEIPEDIQAVKARDPQAARQWREHTRAAITDLLARGYRVAGIGRQAETGRCAYLFRATDR